MGILATRKIDAQAAILQSLSRRPSGDPPDWPNTRGLDKYVEAFGVDIPALLQEGGIYLELGCGEGKALSEAAQLPGVEAYGACLHEQHPLGAPVIYAEFPKDPIIYETFAGTVKVSPDYYGPATYHDDFLRSFITQAGLLGPGGHAFILTYPQRIPDDHTRHQVEKVLSDRSGQTARFQEIMTKSDYDGRDLPAVIVHISGSGEAINPSKDYSRLTKAAGKPQKTKPVWKNSDGSAIIWGLSYAA